MANVHNLKTWTKFFEDVKSGIKQFEVRKNDRNYQVGDTLILEEFDSVKQRKTGAWIPKEVVYMLDDPRFVKEGFVVLGMRDVEI